MGRRLGPYTLHYQIAVGGMAEIYLATSTDDSELDRRVAIKVIHPQNADDPDFIRMLIDEAGLAVQLYHPNIVATYDLGRDEDHYYIVMEFVDGMDLFNVLRRSAVLEHDFPVEMAAYVVREVALGLDYAHRKLDDRGRPLMIVHRDVSPQNVLLSNDGEVKIADFGIAKAAHRAAQTQAGIIKGKYYYMSPEQAWGDPIDARTDIFSAGILLHEMLVGQMLYLEDDLDRLLDVVRKAEIQPPSFKRPSVPRDLEQIVMKALRKRPSDRWQTAGDYAQALTDFLRGYAPSFDRKQLGGFVGHSVKGESTRRRSLHEATAAISRPRLVSAAPRSLNEDFGDEETHLDRGPSYGAEESERPNLIEPGTSMFRLDEDLLGEEATSIADDVSPNPSTPVAPSLPGVRMLDNEPASDLSESQFKSQPTAHHPRVPIATASVASPIVVPSSESSHPPRTVAPPLSHATPVLPQTSVSTPAPSKLQTLAGSSLAQPLPVRQGWGILISVFLVAFSIGAIGVVAVARRSHGVRRSQLDVTSTQQGAHLAIDERELSTLTPVRIVDMNSAGELAVESDPAGAEVFVGDQPKGETPVILRGLPVDKAVGIDLKLAGYRPVHYKASWNGRKTMTARIVLQRAAH